MLQAAAIAALSAGQRAAFGPAVGCLLKRALYSTTAKDDYSLVLSKAMELSAETVAAPLPPGEGGITFGVPLETFKRKVCSCSSTSSSRSTYRRGSINGN